MSAKITDIPGIGPAAAAILVENGYDSIESISASDVGSLSRVPGFGAIRASRVIAAAMEIAPKSKSRKPKPKKKVAKAKKKASKKAKTKSKSGKKGKKPAKKASKKAKSKKKTKKPAKKKDKKKGKKKK